MISISCSDRRNTTIVLEANTQFQKVVDKYKKQGYALDITALATHVNVSNPNQVRENLSFSRRSGFAEPFRQRPDNTRDYSHKRNIVSLGACLAKDELEGRIRVF